MMKINNKKYKDKNKKNQKKKDRHILSIEERENK